jgi:hypothetical protein
MRLTNDETRLLVGAIDEVLKTRPVIATAPPDMVDVLINARAERARKLRRLRSRMQAHLDQR